MRWDAGIRVARQLIAQGALGQPADARIEVSVRTPWHLWPWMARSPRLEVMYHSIHYHDSLRFLFGEPDARHRGPRPVPRPTGDRGDEDGDDAGI